MNGTILAYTIGDGKEDSILVTYGGVEGLDEGGMVVASKLQLPPQASAGNWTPKTVKIYPRTKEATILWVKGKVQING